MREGDCKRLEDWAERNKIPFNSEICRLLYSGNKNAEHIYTMGKNPIKKGLGMVTENRMNMRQQCETVVTRAKVCLGTLGKALYPRHMTSLFSSTLQWYKTNLTSVHKSGHRISRILRGSNMLRGEKQK